MCFQYGRNTPFVIKSESESDEIIRTPRPPVIFPDCNPCFVPLSFSSVGFKLQAISQRDAWSCPKKQLKGEDVKVSLGFQGRNMDLVPKKIETLEFDLNPISKIIENEVLDSECDIANMVPQEYDLKEQKPKLSDVCLMPKDALKIPLKQEPMEYATGISLNKLPRFAAWHPFIHVRRINWFSDTATKDCKRLKENSNYSEDLAQMPMQSNHFYNIDHGIGERCHSPIAKLTGKTTRQQPLVKLQRMKLKSNNKPNGNMLQDASQLQRRIKDKKQLRTNKKQRLNKKSVIDKSFRPGGYKMNSQLGKYKRITRTSKNELQLRSEEISQNKIINRKLPRNVTTKKSSILLPKPLKWELRDFDERQILKDRSLSKNQINDIVNELPAPIIFKHERDIKCMQPFVKLQRLRLKHKKVEEFPSETKFKTNISSIRSGLLLRLKRLELNNFVELTSGRYLLTDSYLHKNNMNLVKSVPQTKLEKEKTFDLYFKSDYIPMPNIKTEICEREEDAYKDLIGNAKGNPKMKLNTSFDLNPKVRLKRFMMFERSVDASTANRKNLKLIKTEEVYKEDLQMCGESKDKSTASFVFENESDISLGHSNIMNEEMKRQNQTFDCLFTADKTLLAEIISERALINYYLTQSGYSPVQFRFENSIGDLELFLDYLLVK